MRKLLPLLGAASVVLLSLPVLAQQGSQETGVNAPVTSTVQELSKAPIPAPEEPKRTFTPPRIEKRVESTELGYEKSVAPGPGRKVTFKGRQYQVAEVAVAGGGPMLFVNHYVIGVLGSSLIVGLKEVDPSSDDLTN